MENGAEYFGGKIFKSITSDERVTKDLAYCLFCTVSSTRSENSFMSTNYKIPLDNINASMKQCPACKAIYILKDPTDA